MLERSIPVSYKIKISFMDFEIKKENMIQNIKNENVKLKMIEIASEPLNFQIRKQIILKEKNFLESLYKYYCHHHHHHH